MENSSTLIAIIAASSAIVGGAIPAIITYFTNKQRYKHDRLKELNNKQKEIYWEFWESLQLFMNHNTDADAFERFQMNVTKLALYADNNTSKKVNDYFENLINLNQAGKLLPRADHERYQTDIMNAMREHLEMAGFDSFRLISFTPQNR